MGLLLFAVVCLIILLSWMFFTLILLGLLGWHPPGWLLSPVAHGGNTLLHGIAALVALVVFMVNNHYI